MAEHLLKAVPTTKLREKTLEKLCQAAERMFMEKNYYNTSINDIVTAAQVSIGTFYNYFPDKLSMYKYIVLKHGKDIRKYIASRLAAADDVKSRREAERAGIKFYLDFCIENPHVINIIWQSLFVAPELFKTYYDDFGKRYEKRLAEAIEAGEVHDVNIEVASYVLMGASNFLAIKYVTFGEAETMTDAQLYGIADDFMQILQRGLFSS